MSDPWKDWIPGVLSKSQMRKLCECGFIRDTEGLDESIDYSSIDLHLTNQGYRMAEGSVKPFGDRYEPLIKSQRLANCLKPAKKDGTFTLKARNIYVFKLRENISSLKKAKIYGQATAKSSVGRVDVLARLIVDGMDCYETFDPDRLKEEGSGEMYLEITPITFNVRVKEGISLSQLRLFYGKPGNAEVHGDELYESLLRNTEEGDGSLSVNLSEVEISGNKVSAFYANKVEEDQKPIDLWEHEDSEEKPSPCEYWKFLRKDKNERLRISKDNFYIMRSKERISLPGGIAVYCRAIDETIGEMRIHYAGFVHPFFGKNRKDEKDGTPLIFEVRGHDVDVSLRHEEKMANLTFYRMSQDCKEPQDRKPTSYTAQELKLSKIFKDWPSKVKMNDDGSVEAIDGG